MKQSSTWNSKRRLDSHRAGRMSARGIAALAALFLYVLLPLMICRPALGQWIENDANGVPLTSNPGGWLSLAVSMGGAAKLTGNYKQLPSWLAGTAYAPNPYPNIYGYYNNEAYFCPPAGSPPAQTIDGNWVRAYASGAAIDVRSYSLPQYLSYNGLPITGGISISSSGTLSGVWQWNGNGNAPDHLDLLVNVIMLADSSASAIGVYVTDPNIGNPAMLGAASSASDKPFGDSVSAATTSSDKGPSQYISALHLVRVPVINDKNNIPSATVSLGAQVSASASDNISSNQCRADANAHIYATARLFTADLQGHSTVDTANWDGGHPRFFSGTGCKAQGTAVAISGSIQEAQLLINGTVVDDYKAADHPSDPAFQTLPLKVTFDSTHFANAAAVTITMKVWDTAGNYYDAATGPAPVKNRVYAVGNQELNSTATAFQSIGTDIHVPSKLVDAVINDAEDISYSGKGSMEDNMITELNTLPEYTAFYTMTHGTGGNFGDSYATAAGGTHYIDATSDAPTNDFSSGGIGYSINRKNQNPNLPPFNFAEVDACNSAADLLGTQLSSSLGYTFMNPQTQIVDRAYMGYQKSVGVNFLLQQFEQSMWEDFSNGFTLQDSIVTSLLVATPTAPLIELPNGSEIIPVPTIPTIYGDGSMKFHGIYGGRDADPDQWFVPH